MREKQNLLDVTLFFYHRGCGLHLLYAIGMSYSFAIYELMYSFTCTDTMTTPSTAFWNWNLFHSHSMRCHGAGESATMLGESRGLHGTMCLEWSEKVEISSCASKFPPKKWDLKKTQLLGDRESPDLSFFVLFKREPCLPSVFSVSGLREAAEGAGEWTPIRWGPHQPKLYRTLASFSWLARIFV